MTVRINAHAPTPDVIQLARIAIAITELTPFDGAFVCKHVNRDGSISQYPSNVLWWQQRVGQIEGQHLIAVRLPRQQAQHLSEG
jgi:hypothetical protein